jgi:hypothetical protein
MAEVKRSDGSDDDFFAYLGKYLRRLPLPPEEFDPLRASPDELQEFGLAAPPDASAEPDLFEFWARMFKAPLRFIDPQFPHPEMLPRLRLPHYRQRPLGVLSRQRRLHSREKSRNWSGIYVRPPHGRRLDYVTARWHVPSPAPPAREPSDAVRGGEYRSSIWVGIDGRRTFPNASLPQIGTSQTVTAAGGAHTAAFGAWWQWWIKDVPAHNRPVEILNFPVAAGDEILASLLVLPGDDVLFHLKNQTKGIFTAFVVARPPDIIPLGATAEWIVERPTKVDDTLMYALPDYGEVVFEDCGARSTAAGGGLGLPLDLREARLIRMYEVFDEPARIAFVSLPERVNRRSARVTFA